MQEPDASRVARRDVAVVDANREDSSTSTSNHFDEAVYMRNLKDLNRDFYDKVVENERQYEEMLREVEALEVARRSNNRKATSAKR